MLFTVHNKLGTEFLESVYKNALLLEHRKSFLATEAEVALSVLYDGIDVGSFYADIIVENKVILELKATERLSPIHEIQLVNYLRQRV